MLPFAGLVDTVAPVKVTSQVGGGAKSGRFVLRLPPFLHAVLTDSARAAGLSLNEYCVRQLSAAGGLAHPDAAALLACSRRVAGDALLAVAVYGSWTRGEASAGSDVDVLIVVDRRLALSPDLYRHWDDDPARWGGRVVDPHFVHPPAEGSWSGLWAEVALDGRPLLDRDGWLTRHLAAIRRDIADGRLVRGYRHGQPYWKEADLRAESPLTRVRAAARKKERGRPDADLSTDGPRDA